MFGSFSLNRIARIAATGAILMVAHFSSAQAAICYKGKQGVNGTNIIASGNKSAVTKGNAQKKARGSWNSKAQSLMGSSRANWGNAQQRSYYCHHSFVWHCTAYARPCM
jgi:hypothetical protein